MLAHETGHFAGGPIPRIKEKTRNALIRSISGMLLGGASASVADGAARPRLCSGPMLGRQAIGEGGIPRLYPQPRAVGLKWG